MYHFYTFLYFLQLKRLYFIFKIAAYSYDNGVAPYTGENPELLKDFTTTLFPDTEYIFALSMDESGLSTFSLFDSNSSLIEVQTVQHLNKCKDNYSEGIVDGLYFGGTCVAPESVIVSYS